MCNASSQDQEIVDTQHLRHSALQEAVSFRASGFEDSFPSLGLTSPRFLDPGSSRGGVVLGLCRQA
eukprot:4044753-Pyramimonas_sp.AAC.1